MPGPDLLLLDMHLPKYNGEEILKCLRSTERYAQIPVVVMTSSDAPADHDLGRKTRAAMCSTGNPSCRQVNSYSSAGSFTTYSRAKRPWLSV